MSKAKKLFNVGSNILNYSLDLAWHGSTDITHLVWVDIIPYFLQSTSQDSHNFVGFGSPSSQILPKLQNYKNMAALTFAFKKARDDINPGKVRDIYAATPRRI